MTYHRNKDCVCLYKCCGCAVTRSNCKWVAAIVVLVGIVLAIVAMSMTWKKIDHDEFGVVYNTYSMKFDKRILGEGRHTMREPFGDVLKLFSDNVNTKEETVQCVSKNGLIVSFTISTQFRINRPEVFDILYEWTDQDSLFSYLDFPIRDAVRDSCARFLGKEFFQLREEVERDLAANVSITLRDDNNHVTPLFVQLRNIGLPSDFLTAIQAVQSELENVQIEESKREGILIQARTDLIAAQQDAQITIIRANAAANGIRDLANQKGNARTVLWSQRLGAVQFGVQSLSMTPKDYVEQVLFPELVSQTTSPTTQACLQTCTSTNCWYCWVRNAVPAVTI